MPSVLALIGQSVEGRDPCPACRASPAGWCPPCGGPIRMWCCGQHWSFPHHPECNYFEDRQPWLYQHAEPIDDA